MQVILLVASLAWGVFGVMGFMSTFPRLTSGNVNVIAAQFHAVELLTAVVAMSFAVLFFGLIGVLNRLEADKG